MEDPRPTENLGDAAAWPFEDGVDEIVIRVTGYKADGVTPSSYQAIAKRRDRTNIWGVGSRANPVMAILKAISEVYSRADDGWPDGKAHGFTREPLFTGASAAEVAQAEEIAEPDDDELDIEDLLS